MRSRYAAVLTAHTSTHNTPGSVRVVSVIAAAKAARHMQNTAVRLATGCSLLKRRNSPSMTMSAERRRKALKKELMMLLLLPLLLLPPLT